MSRFANALFIILTGLVWLQTRYIFAAGELGNARTEYGTIGIFVTELLALELMWCFASRMRGMIQKSTFKNPYVGAAALLAVIAMASALYVRIDSGSWYPLILALRIVVGLDIFLGIIWILKPKFTHVLGALTFGAVVNALFGWWQFLTQAVEPNKWLGIARHLPQDLGTFVVETADARWLRAYGTMPHPNIFGTLEVIGVLAALGLASRARDPFERLAAISAAILMSSALVLSFSREAAIGLAVGLVCLALVAKRSDPAAKKKLFVSIAAVVLAVASTGLAVREPLLARVSADGRLEARSISEREQGIADAFALIKKHPLLGVGLGQMPAASLAEIPGKDGFSAQPVHDEPLLVMVELGIFGLAAWLWLRYALIKGALKKLKNIPADRLLIASIPLAMLVAITTIGLFDHFFWDSWTGQLLFWITAGLSVADQPVV